MALVAIVWIAVGAALGGPRPGGPLSSSSGYAVHARLASGEVLSWSLGLPLNHTDRDAVIRAVDLVGVRGIDVLGIVATYGVDMPDGSCVSAGATYGFPPTDTRQDGTTYKFPTREIVGTVVPSEGDRTCRSHPSISVGVRRMGATEPSGIEGLRVRYQHAGVDYEVMLPWSLTVEPKQ